MMTPEQALSHWDWGGDISESPDQGLINQTHVVGRPPVGILQWVNPIFDPRIHEDLTIILHHIREKGLPIPTLHPTSKGRPCLLDEKGCWRLWSYIPGTTHHRIYNADMAWEAGRCVGQFHTAVADLNHHFLAPTRDIHHTPARMDNLKVSLGEAQGHPLEKEACTLGEEILAAWERWEGELHQRQRICHGDLKISNLRFSLDGKKSICLLDLDTIGPQSISVEMGDAWRSWCNPGGENEPEKIHFDLSLFEASLRGWAETAPALDPEEQDNLIPGIERICLELSARFCADALQNNYFKEDRKRFPDLGKHNLIRAQGQMKLGQSARQHAHNCENILKKVMTP